MLGLKGVQTDDPNAIQISDPIGAENNSKNLRDKVVQLFTGLQFGKKFTLRAGFIRIFFGTIFHRTVFEHRFFAVTAFAFTLREHSALGTHQPAIGYFYVL
jgi:hypothetical protein